ncbi:hypothetical protein L6R29_18345 [Myxococcota bacterium]|nr:hypothetical protein [Myxococcota bacterium]
MDRLSAEDTNEGNLDASLKSMLITTYEKQDLHGFFFLGSQYPKSRKLVEEVWKQETHQTWAKDLTFVCGSWLSRLRHQALQMKIFPQEVEQIKKLKIVSEKKLMDYLADLILLKDTSTGGFTPTMMEENKNMIFW